MFPVAPDLDLDIETAHSGLRPTLPATPDMEFEAGIGNILYLAKVKSIDTKYSGLHSLI